MKNKMESNTVCIDCFSSCFTRCGKIPIKLTSSHCAHNYSIFEPFLLEIFIETQMLLCF